MKNFTFTLALVLVSILAFGQSNFGKVTFNSPFVQKTDTLLLVGIDSSEVKIELADYSCNVNVLTSVHIINEKEFTDEENLFLLKEISIAEVVEEQSKIFSNLDRFRNKNVQIGGKTPIIQREVVLTLKKNTTVIYAN